MSFGSKGEEGENGGDGKAGSRSHYCPGYGVRTRVGGFVEMALDVRKFSSSWSASLGCCLVLIGLTGMGFGWLVPSVIIGVPMDMSDFFYILVIFVMGVGYGGRLWRIAHPPDANRSAFLTRRGTIVFISRQRIRFCGLSRSSYSQTPVIQEYEIGVLRAVIFNHGISLEPWNKCVTANSIQLLYAVSYKSWDQSFL